MREAACRADADAAAADAAAAAEEVEPESLLAIEAAEVGFPVPCLPEEEVGGPGSTMVRWADLKVWTMPGWDCFFCLLF